MSLDAIMVKRVALLLVSILVCLSLAEAVLRNVAPSQVIGVGTDLTPNAQYYGWALPPNDTFPFFHPDTGQYVSEDRINSRGWRDVEHSLPKPAGTFRIVFVGDSNTFGVVPLADLYTRQVERLLHAKGFTHVEVISIGVGAWGTDQALEALQREGMLYRPDMAIYQFCGNDVTDNLQPRNDANTGSIFQKKPFRYEVAGNTLRRMERQVRHDPVPVTLRIKKTLLKSALIWNLNLTRLKLSGAGSDVRTPAGQGLMHPGDPVGAAPILSTASAPPDVKLDPGHPLFPYHYGPMSGELQAAWRLLELLILRMQSVCRDNGAQFLVFSEESDVGKRAWHLRWGHFQSDGDGDFLMRQGQRYAVNWQRPLQNLQAICGSNGIPVIAPRREYRRYTHDSHPDAAGNRAMAEDIVDVLIRHPGLPGGGQR